MTWFQEFLVDEVHYVSVSRDLSDLEEKIRWCIENDKECEQIAKNAKDFYDKYLSEKGISINCYDPASMSNAKNKYSSLRYFDSAYGACDKVDAIIIGTEWNEFRALNFSKIKEKIKDAIIFDLRNIYRRAELEELGFEIISDMKNSSVGVVTVKLPKEINSRYVGDNLRELGFETSYASEYLLTKNWLQICTMGEVDLKEVSSVVDMLDSICTKSKSLIS